MKYSIACLLMMLVLLRCTPQNNSFLNNKIYYAIKPDNFLGKTRFSIDTIIMETYMSNGDQHGNDRAVLKIHKTVWKNKTCFLYVEQFKTVGTISRQEGFSILGCTPDGPDKLLLTAKGRTFATLQECEKQELWIPDNYFAITIYSPKMLDSFKSFKRITELDTSTACLLKTKVNDEYKKEEQKINEFAKQDVYLSETSKELLTRALIGMHVNPLDFTNEDAGRVFKMCLNSGD